MKKFSVVLWVAVLVVGVSALLAQQGRDASGQQTEPAAPAGDVGSPAEGAPETDQAPTGPKGGFGDLMLPLALMFVVVYFFLLRPRKKQQQQQQEMLTSMKKNDRIRTIGGIIGTVVDVRDDEVVIKIDESTNTKIRMVRQAISKVFKEGQE